MNERGVTVSDGREDGPTSTPLQDVDTLQQKAYDRVRAFTEQLASTLSVEDMVVQSMPDASPTKWHWAHTTWFFENFVLVPNVSGYRVFHPEFRYLFNSYYNALGRQFDRPSRGVLSRPTVDETRAYRAHVDAAMRRLFTHDASLAESLAPVIEIGLQHEQQHQELLLTDIKHAFAQSPLAPRFEATPRPKDGSAPQPMGFCDVDEGVYEVGHAGEGFHYDNEGPRHRVFLEPYALADRPVSNAEYMAFMDDGGYERPELWMSEGWAFIQAQHIMAPLYWRRHVDDEFCTFSLYGVEPIEPAAPVCHLSWFEATAFAAWMAQRQPGVRLPTEQEWEVALQLHGDTAGTFVEESKHPGAIRAHGRGLQSMLGGVWEWTRSSYEPYPGYRCAQGALGEYNGKFMANQYVLRGGSCATSRDHIRSTYRNFFPATARWQFAGLRLARG